MPTTTPFNNLITFSRGSNATVTGSNGLIQWAPNNLITFSEQFDNGAWIAFSATASANATLAPDGTRTADKIAEVAGGAGQSRYATSTAPYITITASCYVKASERTFSRIAVSGGGSAQWFGATFDVQNGVVTQQNAGASGTVSGATITAVGDGWYRCTVTGLTGATSGNTFTYIGPSDSGTPTAGSFGVVAYTGTAGSGVFAWGAQLELGSTATTYNPTTVKNLLGFSEAFDNAAWTKSGSSIVTGAQANPVNGAFNAQKLMEDTSTGQHRVFNTTGVTYIASTPVCFSAYVKAAERSFVYFRLNNSGADFVTGFINLTTGAVTTVTGAGSITATNVGSGWWRIAAIGTSAAATPVSGYIATATSGSVVSYTGDGNSGVYIYGAQLSDSASLDPYVPTPGAAPSSTAFYGPRFDFDPVTLQPRGLLVEEQRTNLFTYSDDFANAAWTKSSATVTANQAVSPDGTTNADLLQITAQFGRLQAGSVTLGTVYTFSIWARTATGTRVYSLYDAAGNPIGTLTATTAWTRHTITFTAPATSTLYVMQDRNAGPFVDTFIYGAQLEVGAFATSYIPTVASTVTRSADVATITGQNFAQWFGQAEGTFVADVLDNAAGVNVLVASDGTTTNQLIMASSTLNIFSVFTGGAFQAQLGVTPPAPYKTAGAYKVNDFAAAANGGTVSTDTSGALATYSRLSIGTNAVGNAAFLNGHIRRISFIPARAADFQLQALST